LIALGEPDIRALGLTKDADVRRAVAMVDKLQQEQRTLSKQMDALYAARLRFTSDLGEVYL
jgi:hypothetical protein